MRKKIGKPSHEKYFHTLTVKKEFTGKKYNRKKWSGWRSETDRLLGWNTVDCKLAFYENSLRCPVGKSFPILNRDHLVPVAEAFRSGGYMWNKKKKKKFFNDTANIWLMNAGSNRLKSDHQPLPLGYKSRWVPEDMKVWCTYALMWTDTKRKWKLSVDPVEAEGLTMLLETCKN